MKKYIVYLLAAVMVLSPIAVFADPLTEGQAGQPAVEDQLSKDQPVAEQQSVAEESVGASMHVSDVKVLDESRFGTWDADKEHFTLTGQSEPLKDTLYKVYKNNGTAIVALFYFDATGLAEHKEGPVTVSKTDGDKYYSFQNNGFDYDESLTGPVTYWRKYDSEYSCYCMDETPGIKTDPNDGKKYYLNDKRIVQTDPGLITVNNIVYYVQDGGAICTTQGFVTDTTSGKKYYVNNSNGEIRKAVGKFQANDGKWYFTQSGGEVPSAVGLYSDGTNQYFVQNANGEIQTAAGFITVGSKRYLVTNGGAISKQAGTVPYGGKYYATNPDGSIITTVGITSSGGKYYYVTNTSGVLAVSKAVKAGKKTYHAGSNGILAVGVHKYKKSYYYSDSKAVVRTKTGIVKWNGGYYHVKKGGKLTTNKKVKYKKKSYITSKKAKIYTGLFTWKKTKYYASKKGVLKAKAGVITWDGDKYFVRAGGKVAKNATAKAKGKTYHCAKSGKIVIGYHKWTNKKYYLTNPDGSLITKVGMYDYKGKTYYVKKGGAMASKSFVDYKGKHYYAGSDGAILKKAFNYNGITITPDSSTGAISEEDYARVFPKDEPKEV